MPAHPTRLDLVLAEWCPHCVPLSVDAATPIARTLGIPLRLLDIDDRAQETVADDLVRRYGDWDPDYLIPQAFLEWSDGRVEHLMTGSPSGLADTRRSWERVRLRLTAPTGAGPD